MALLTPISVRIQAHEDAPADDLTAVFALERAVPAIAAVRVFDGAQAVFSGVVDEQTMQVTQGGATLKLVARSRAALLLDNEAMPREWSSPSLQELYDAYVQPYGFCGFVGNSGRFATKLNVTKGMSHWQVVEEFCIRCFGTVPRVTAEDVLDCSGELSGAPLVFDNADQTALPYLSAVRSCRFYKRVSELYLQPKAGKAYTAVLHDTTAHRLGIFRRRFAVANNYRGARMIDSARRKAEEIAVVCPGGVRSGLKAPAVLRDSVLGTLEKLSVAGWTYTQSVSGERCAYLLRCEDI